MSLGSVGCAGMLNSLLPVARTAPMRSWVVSEPDAVMTSFGWLIDVADAGPAIKTTNAVARTANPAASGRLRRDVLKSRSFPRSCPRPARAARAEALLFGHADPGRVRDNETGVLRESLANQSQTGVS